MDNEVTIPDFIPLQHVSIPQGATHVELSAALMDFNFETEESQLVTSNLVNLVIDATMTNVLLSFASLPSGTGNRYCFLKVAFFQQLNGQQYALMNGAHNALQIIDIQ